jgi:DNA repair protein RecO (recombination protein O)
MAALLSGNWAGAEATAVDLRREASGLIAAHLQWHLERQLRTLPLVERAYRVDRTVADQRVALFGQDVPHGNQKGEQDPISPIASGT